MRRRILQTLLASTSIMLVAFIVPLMVLMNSWAADRVKRHVVLEVQPLVSRIPVADAAALEELVGRFTAETDRPATVYLPDGSVVGSPVAPDVHVDQARAEGASYVGAVRW